MIGALLKFIKTKDLGKLDEASRRVIDEDKEEKSGVVSSFNKVNQPLDVKLPDADQIREGVNRGRASFA